MTNPVRNHSALLSADFFHPPADLLPFLFQLCLHIRIIGLHGQLDLHIKGILLLL